MLPSSHTVLVFAGVALLFAASPGPNFIYVLTRSVSQGRSVGLASTLGICTGGLLHTLAAALGLSALLLSSALAFTFVKWAGAIYLIYLGVRMLIPGGDESSKNLGLHTEPGYANAYRQGFITMMLNPKAALYFFAFLPQFVTPAAETGDLALATQLVSLGLIQVLAALAVYTTLALASGSFGALLRGSPRYRLAQRRFAGCVYIALGASVALGGRK